MKGLFRVTFLIVAVCTASLSSFAQSAPKPDTVKKAKVPVPIKPKGPKPLNHEWSAGIRLNTDGWSIYTDLGKIKAKNPRQSDMFYNETFWQLEFTEKKDAREQKIDGNDPSGNPSKYVYGKINDFYAFKLGIGFRTLIAGKPDPGSVSIHWVNVLGASLGLLKPYYINVYTDPSAIKYSDATQADFLDQNVIEGSAGFTKGLDQIKFIPGGHYKSALHFDFSTNRKNVLAVEAGVNVEYYSQAIPIMANDKGVPYFVDFFIAAQFGRRW